ncbi:hypothetical protein D035_2405 [Vibrio parahaemolyticus VP250]|nr:hypothetical protein D035_2405 [Vibrio parahaemolyticus VP250]
MALSHPMREMSKAQYELRHQQWRNEEIQYYQYRLLDE